MAYQIREVSWEQEKDNLKAVREKVFVCEWRIPRHQEFDRQDVRAHHVLVTNDEGQPLATGRLTNNGQISRVAVIMSERHSDLPLQIISKLMSIAKDMGLKEVYINSPLTEVTFFQRQSFKPCGAVYTEAGLPMQRMVLSIDNAGLKQYHQTH